MYTTLFGSMGLGLALVLTAGAAAASPTSSPDTASSIAAGASAVASQLGESLAPGAVGTDRHSASTAVAPTKSPDLLVVAHSQTKSASTVRLVSPTARKATTDVKPAPAVLKSVDRVVAAPVGA